MSSSKNYQKKRYSSDKDITKRKIEYNDFILLKESYIELGEKYKILKDDHKNINKLLKEYQNQITEFQKTKSTISEMFKQIKEKIIIKKNQKVKINIKYQRKKTTKKLFLKKRQIFKKL